MRFRRNLSTYEVGQRRYNSGFLFIPKTIKGETRWLEFATWVEVYYPGDFYTTSHWRETKWVNE